MKQPTEEDAQTGSTARLRHALKMASRTCINLRRTTQNEELISTTKQM